MFTAEVLLVSVSVDPPDVLLHVAGGDQSSTVLAHFLTANLNLLTVIFLSVLQIQRFTVETFITMKASISPLFLPAPKHAKETFSTVRCSIPHLVSTSTLPEIHPIPSNPTYSNTVIRPSTTVLL